MQAIAGENLPGKLCDMVAGGMLSTVEQKQHDERAKSHEEP